MGLKTHPLDYIERVGDSIRRPTITQTRQTSNWERIGSNWKEMRGKVKAHWGQLTDDQLDQIEGKRDQLVGKIHEKYGISKEEADRQITERFSGGLNEDEVSLRVKEVERASLRESAGMGKPFAQRG